jgi:hypothetical protein
MKKKISGPQVLTANLLSNGLVVFLGRDGAWRKSIDTAALARSTYEVASLTDRGAEFVSSNLVVDPYLVEVEESASGLVPVELRERRRLAGPSVPLGYYSRTSHKPAFAA